VTALERDLVDEQIVSDRSSQCSLVPYTEEQADDNIVCEDKEEGEVPSDPETQCVSHECLNQVSL